MNLLDKYKVDLDIFAGPLDLLLHLIKKNEIDIYDIPISEITDKYIEYIDLIKKLNLDMAGEFLVMAATLTHIKSKMLLPLPEMEEEEDDGIDPREELMRRLIMYKMFKEASLELTSRQVLGRDVFRRGMPVTLDDIRDDTEEEEELAIDSTVFDLIDAFKDILKRFPKDYTLDLTVERFRLTDKINFIMEKLGDDKSVIFEELFPSDATRGEVIVTFLAILELAKSFLIKVYQGDEGVIRLYGSGDENRKVDMINEAIDGAMAEYGDEGDSEPSDSNKTEQTLEEELESELNAEIESELDEELGAEQEVDVESLEAKARELMEELAAEQRVAELEEEKVLAEELEAEREAELVEETEKAEIETETLEEEIVEETVEETVEQTEEEIVEETIEEPSVVVSEATDSHSEVEEQEIEEPVKEEVAIEETTNESNVEDGTADVEEQTELSSKEEEIKEEDNLKELEEVADIASEVLAVEEETTKEISPPEPEPEPEPVKVSAEHSAAIDNLVADLESDKLKGIESVESSKASVEDIDDTDDTIDDHSEEKVVEPKKTFFGRAWSAVTKVTKKIINIFKRRGNE